MADGLPRSTFLRAAALLAGGVVLAPTGAWAAGRRVVAGLSLAARNAGRRYAGDRTMFATVSPGVLGRDTATISFGLNRTSTVTLEAVRTALRKGTVIWRTTARFTPGRHELAWAPPLETPVGSYVMRLTIDAPGGHRTVLGDRRPASVERQAAPVVRVLGVEAAFLQRSYAPGTPMELRILADTPSLTLQFLHCGAEAEGTLRIDEMKGAPVGDLVPLDWAGKRSGPVTILVQTGAWPSGVYTARLTTPDGRVGFAPFVLRSTTPGLDRQLVVVPTNTWQAYNFYDADGDGWGDTWYAGGSPPVRLDRPYRDRGVPPRYKRYDLGYLKWLQWTGKTPDYVAEDDLETVTSGDQLRALYDLVVFPGHTEYVTAHAYDVVQRYRDLGGRLVFLSANNFFWRVDRDGTAIRRIRLWREDGRPEAGLLGVQYRANDDGSRQAPFTVTSVANAPWLFEGTGLVDGSLFGDVVGGYGIEIDATTPASPPGTQVLATIPNLFGPGLTAEMSYYESPAGARVFSAGALDFGGSITFWPMRRMMDNLWAHMLAP